MTRPESPPRALSVRQPHAAAFFFGNPVKDVENRSRPTEHRGTVFIHAALKEDVGWRKSPMADALAALPPEMTAVRGAIIGMVQLTACIRDSESPWAARGSWHWAVEFPIPFPSGIIERGRLSLWVPETAWLRTGGES